MSFKKWYFAANTQAIEGSFDLIHSAVVSARENTSLVPICIIEDTDYSTNVHKRLQDLSRAGVEIIKRNAEVFPLVQNAFGIEKSRPFTGHWLRTDIPLIESDDEFVLYTDIDVIFRKDVSRFDIRPKFIACAPENAKDDWSYFNSGVMVMNIPNLRSSRNDFIEIIKEHMPNATPYDDQLMYNICYGDRYEQLDYRLNWKPYWGFSDEAEIVHFHGPKPGLVRHIRGGGDLKGLDVYVEMYGRNKEGYESFIYEFDKYRNQAL